MIILIGGVSCSGKTLMAQRLLERYGFPYLSLDHIKMGLIRAGIDCGFTQYDSDTHITGKLWPIARGIVMTAIENKQNLIIEGCYLPADALQDLPDAYRKYILAFSIVFSQEYIEKNFVSGILRHARDIESRGEEERPLNWFIKAHTQTKAECLRCGAQFFEIESDYEKEIKNAYSYLEENIV